MVTTPYSKYTKANAMYGVYHRNVDKLCARKTEYE